ncbi:MAG TPA: APC family permease [Pyrinomonadaceae bacterium]|jgi:amino acid transporter|nr:APC family permease [Pyrinomonadaceae bacterium]
MCAHIDSTKTNGRAQVIVATSVMLSFISFWRAAAIVLNDLGSSAYYVGGIAEKAVGQAAPWFILGVMLFSYAVRAVYIESCAMFTRGGVYRVVKEAMGGTLAKLSVSALMFDYMLTGPISGVSAGQYIVGLISQVSVYIGHSWTPSVATVNYIAAGIAALITVYFWWRNTRGLHESSDDALRIMYVTTAMVVLLIGWCTFTILIKPNMQKLPPAPVPHNLTFDRDAVGWMPKLVPNSFQKIEGPPQQDTAESHFTLTERAGILIGLIGILMAFGHSFLAMSGEESLAQVNRELEFPKHKNLMRAGLIIFLYSLLFTSLVSFFAYAIIPDNQRPQYFDNLISGIALNLAGPMTLKLAFQAFIVIVGFLMLAGAINTAIVGANGVLNRVSEDGVMTDWFRAPHRRFGTTYRMINLIVILQLVAIFASRGNTYTLGEAYAFGVIWSFAFKALAVLVLRFKEKSAREWKVPFNLNLAGNELPIGLGVITALLFSIAGVNLFTKEVATISGIAFTIVFFAIFSISEKINERRHAEEIHTTTSMDQFRLDTKEGISNETAEVRPGNTLCLVRDYNTLGHLKKALELTHTGKKDLVVMTVHVMRGPDTGYADIAEDRLFSRYEQYLFSKVVALAEKAGKSVHLLVVPSSNIFQAIVMTAAQLQSSDIIAGASSVMTPDRQAKILGDAWEHLENRPHQRIRFQVVGPNDEMREYYLGAHAPELTDEEIDFIHKLWLDVTHEPGLENTRHKQIVVAALVHLADELHGERRNQVLKFVKTLQVGEDIKAAASGRRQRRKLVQ